MKAKLWIPVFLLLCAATSLAAHDLFLRPERFFVRENTRVRVRVLNGTFSSSDGAVARNRLRDLRMITPAGATPLDTAAWLPKGDTSLLSLETGEAGTYLVGASLLPRFIRLEAEKFNQYLTSDGVPDILERRRRQGELDRPARERYSKHVKTLLQVGERRTAGFDQVLGYPVELVPLDNPYRLQVGGTLRVRALADGTPLPNQFIVSGGRTASGERIAQRGVRADSAGIARIRIHTRGDWYVKFIYMVPVQEDTVDYESKWTTLTFGVR
jgi:hypothetical protein